MKRLLLYTTAFVILTACSEPNKLEDAGSFTNQDLLKTLEILSHDSLEGRGFGTLGNYKAQDFIAKQFKDIGIAPAFETGYKQEFEHTLSKRRKQRQFPIDNPGENLANVTDTTLRGGNIVARINGQSDKIIVITAHLDHLGIRDDKIYNGADDDASGVSALFSIAEHFKSKNPYHTLIIAAVDAEEIGSPGCKYLAANFPGGIENVILNINMDMIAHNDSSELWAVGTYHNPQLKGPLTYLETNIKLLYGHDDPNDEKLDDWTRSSDHRIFHDLEIPFIYFGVEDHKDYHRDTDTFDNINQEFYLSAVSLIIDASDSYDDFFRPTN